MNIQVVSAEGERHELITITQPVTIVRGEKLDRLICGDVEHWFTKDGKYDGWNTNVAGAGTTPPRGRSIRGGRR